MNIQLDTFSKSEKLCSTKIISGLFETGKIFHYSFFKVVYTLTTLPSDSPVQTAFSVSKRGFRHAVSRNLARRRMREAFRKNKHLLYEHLLKQNKQLGMMIILKGDTIPDYRTIEITMKGVLTKLVSITSDRAEKC